MKIERRKHPRGEAGTHSSMQEVARRAAEGRLDPRTRAWSIEVIDRAGRPKGAVAQATAILEALRRERFYVPDPTDAEFVPSAACTLVGCEGLKFLGEDCDGLLVSFLSAIGSIGIEGAVVGHGYPERQPDGTDAFNGELSHVLAGVFDGSTWIVCDPSTHEPFGVVGKPAREKWITVPNIDLLCDSAVSICDPARMGSGISGARMRPYGDFVGVGSPSVGSLAGPARGTLGAPAEIVLQDVGAPYVKQSLAQRAGALQAQLDEARYRYIYLTILRQQYLDRPIVDPTPGDPVAGMWKSADEQYYKALVDFSERAVRYVNEAIRGERVAGYDPAQAAVVVLGKPGEPTLQMDAQGNMTIGGASPGNSAIVPSVYTGQVGLGALAFAAIVVISVSTVALGYFAWDAVKAHIDAGVKTSTVALYDKMLEKGYSPEEASVAMDKVGESIANEAAAKAALEREKNTGTRDITDTIQLALYGLLGIGIFGAGVYAVSTFGPMLRAAASRRRDRSDDLELAEVA